MEGQDIILEINNLITRYLGKEDNKYGLLITTESPDSKEITLKEEKFVLASKKPLTLDDLRDLTTIEVGKVRGVPVHIVIETNKKVK